MRLSQEEIPSLGMAAFLKLPKNKGDLLIDVREVYEFDAGHLPMAKNLPISIFADCLAEIPKNKQLYIVCEHGVRSLAVCRFLRDNGFEQVTNITEGMSALR